MTQRALIEQLASTRSASTGTSSQSTQLFFAGKYYNSIDDIPEFQEAFKKDQEWLRRNKDELSDTHYMGNVGDLVANLWFVVPLPVT